MIQSLGKGYVYLMKSKKRNNGVRIYLILSSALYGLALLICLICNFAVSRTVSWALIVLVSLMCAYSVTNIPLMLKKHRLTVSMAMISVLLYVLLFTCSLYTGGDWLFAVAYPILTVCLVFVWSLLITAKYLPLNWDYKTAILFALSGIFTVTLNPFVDYLLGQKFDLAFSLAVRGSTSNTAANRIVFCCFLLIALISLTAGIIKAVRSRHTYR